MTQLINPVGPEANNARAADFEDQMVGWMTSLGWDVRCRNVDLFAENGGQSKGIDVLAAYDDPQTGHRLGLLGEAKIRHPLTVSKTQKEVATLSKKLADLVSVVPKLSIGEDIDATQAGLLAYDAHPFQPSTIADALSTMQLVGTTRAEWPRQIWAVGPDTLISMADAFGRCEPYRFYWPPFGRSDGRWSAAAPPQQVGAGVLAWKNRRGTVCLWLRDPLPHDGDFPEISTLVWEWQINVARIICSSVTRDHWRTQTTRWEAEVKKAKNRSIGTLPDEIEPRGLSWDTMTPWTDRWGQQEAEAA